MVGSVPVPAACLGRSRLERSKTSNAFQLGGGGGGGRHFGASATAVKHCKAHKLCMACAVAVLRKNLVKKSERTTQNKGVVLKTSLVCKASVSEERFAGTGGERKSPWICQRGKESKSSLASFAKVRLQVGFSVDGTGGFITRIRKAYFVLAASRAGARVASATSPLPTHWTAEPAGSACKSLGKAWPLPKTKSSATTKPGGEYTCDRLLILRWWSSLESIRASQNIPPSEQSSKKTKPSGAVSWKLAVSWNSCTVRAKKKIKLLTCSKRLGTKRLKKH